jgi:hypothetical protein
MVLDKNQWHFSNSRHEQQILRDQWRVQIEKRGEWSMSVSVLQCRQTDISFLRSVSATESKKNDLFLCASLLTWGSRCLRTLSSGSKLSISSKYGWANLSITDSSHSKPEDQSLTTQDGIPTDLDQWIADLIVEDYSFGIENETMSRTHSVMAFLHWVSVGFSTRTEHSHDCQSSIGIDLAVCSWLVARISPSSWILFDAFVSFTTTLEMGVFWLSSARSNAEA